MGTSEHESVERFLHYMLDCFMRGRFREAVERIAMPMVIYSERSRILLARNREEAALFLAAGWLDLRSRAARFEQRLLCVGEASRGEFPVQVEWRHLDAAGRELAARRVRYIMGRDRNGRLRIHMTEVFGPSWVRAIEMPAGRYA